MNKNNLPLSILLPFAVITVLMYNFGPMEWNGNNQLLATLFIVICWVAVWVGYLIGTAKRATSLPIIINTIKIIKYGAICSIVSLPFSIYAYTGGSLLNVSLNLELQGEVHQEFYQHIVTLQSSIFRLSTSLIRSLLSPLIYGSIILGFKEWSNIDKHTKIFFMLAVLSQVLFSFSRGTDKEIVDLLIFLIAALLVGYRIGVIRNIFKYLIIGLMLFAFLNVFVERREARYLNNMPECFSVDKVCVDVNTSVVARIIGRANYLGLSSFTNYLTQGYHGLSLAFDLEFQPMFGLGHAPAAARLVERLTGAEKFFSRAYNVRLSDVGWDSRFAWSSLFTWIANDTSFYLVPVIMAAIGYALSRAWKEAYFYSNDVSYIVFVYLFLLLIYSPANNQLAISFEIFVGWMFWFFWWVLKRRPLDIRRRTKNY